MVTSVNKKNMVTIPAEVRRRLGIKPGSKLEWQPVEGRKEILVRVIPCRGELALQLLGTSRRFSPDRDAVAELVAERAADNQLEKFLDRLDEQEGPPDEALVGKYVELLG